MCCSRTVHELLITARRFTWLYVEVRECQLLHVLWVVLNRIYKRFAWDFPISVTWGLWVRRHVNSFTALSAPVKEIDGWNENYMGNFAEYVKLY